MYFSEINLANVAMSSSSDNGETWNLENFFGAVLTDRQWMEADRPGEYYFVANAFGGGTGIPPNVGTGHYISKTTDGGKTFTTGVPDTEGGSGLGDIRVDKRTGTMYEAHYGSNVLSMAAFRKARDGDLTATDTNTIAEGVSMLAHWPAFDLDPAGNLYMTWDETATATAPQASGTSAPPTRPHWSAPTGEHRRQHRDLAVARRRRPAASGIAWLEADTELPDNDAETPGTTAGACGPP